jgi:hypothetical protein
VSATPDDQVGKLHLLERETFRLLEKVHAQSTICEPSHTNECRALTTMFGHNSWDEWATFRDVNPELE